MKTLFEHLLDYADSGRISFAMPGHKGGRGLSEEFRARIAEIDVTELDGTENLHSPGAVIAAAEQQLAELYGSKKSFFLTGGSTEGVHVMLHAACAGKKLLVNRTCHRSVINCCVLSGIVPVFIPQGTDAELLVPECVTPAAVEDCLLRNPDAAAVMITSPSYYGQIADVEKIAGICHSHGVPLLVDEAHGAHFAAPGMPKGAIRCGADMAVQSAHKTLNALNQAAFLHVGGEIIDPMLASALTMMVGTSSPSYPIVASAQLAAQELCGDAWKKTAEYICEKKRQLTERTRILMPQGNIDPTRVVFGLRDYDITGYEAMRKLGEEYKIDAEMSDYSNVVCIITPSNTVEEIDALFAAAEEICAQCGIGKKLEISCAPVLEAEASPRRAFYAEHELIPLAEACGRTAACSVAAYPPGIALICSGEHISGEMIDYINTIMKMGAAVEGLEDGCIRVIAE